jgi:hypothetical protein
MQSFKGSIIKRWEATRPPFLNSKVKSCKGNYKNNKAAVIGTFQSWEAFCNVSIGMLCVCEEL